MIPAHLIPEVIARADAAGLSETLITALRRQWPGHSFT